MEDIEYLEEYEDLILPTIKSNSGQVNFPARGGNTTNNMMQDEDSSSIDQDIFESLFDDNSDDESNILQKKVDPKLSQRRLDDRASLDSLDMLVKDLVGEQSKTQTQNNASTSGSGSKACMQLSKKMTSTPNALTAAKRGLQKASTSKPSPLLKGRTGPPTKILNSKAPTGSRPLIHHKFSKRTPTVETTSMANTPKAKPVPTKSSTRPDTNKNDKSKSVATVRPTVQQQQQNRLPSDNANRSVSSSSSPRPSSSSLVNLTARKQMAAALQKNKNLSLPLARRPVQRPPTTIVKPEKREMKDPSEDPLSLDDIAEALLDSDSDSFSLSDISDNTLDSLSDFDEDPHNVIDISNDSSIDGKINHKDLDNVRAETPSPTVSEDREDITLSPSPPQIKTNVGKFQLLKRPDEANVTKQNAARLQVDIPSTSIKKVPEKLTIISDTLLSRIDTALLATAIVDDPQIKTMEKTNSPALSVGEISSAAEICTNEIFSITQTTTNEVASSNADILDEFHEAADFIEENIEHEEKVEEEIKESIKEDLQTTSLVTEEVVVANKDKNDSNIFLDDHVDDETMTDQQKENIEVAMEVEIETNVETENPTEFHDAIDNTIFEETVAEEENIEECEDIAGVHELIEECDGEVIEAIEETKITGNTETQAEANKIENPEDQVKLDCLGSKHEADSVISTSLLESIEANEKAFKEPLNPRDNIKSKEESTAIDLSTLSKRSIKLPLVEESEETTHNVPAKKAKLAGRIRTRFRNLGDSDQATDTSESEFEILPAPRRRRRQRAEMSEVVESNVDSKNTEKHTQEILRENQNESETETETETYQILNAGVSGNTNESKQKNHLEKSLNNAQSDKSTKETAKIEKQNQNEEHDNTKPKSTPKKTEKVVTSNEKDIVLADKSLNSENGERKNKEPKELQHRAEDTDICFLETETKKEDAKTPTKMRVRLKRVEEKYFNKMIEETEESIVPSTMPEDNLVDAIEKSADSTSSNKIETNEEIPQIKVLTKLNKENNANNSLETDTIAESNLKVIEKIEKESNENEEVDIARKTLKLKDAEDTLQSENNSNDKHSNSAGSKTRGTLKTDDADKVGNKMDDKEFKESKVVNEIIEHTTRSDNKSSEESNVTPKDNERARRKPGRPKGSKERSFTNQQSQHVTRSAYKIKDADAVATNDDNKTYMDKNSNDWKNEHTKSSAVTSKESNQGGSTDDKKKSREANVSDSKIELMTKSVVETKATDKVASNDKKSSQRTNVGGQNSERAQRNICLATRNARNIKKEEINIKPLASESLKLSEKTAVDTKTHRKETPSKSTRAEEEKSPEKNTNITEDEAGKSNIKSPSRTNFIVRRNYKNQAISQRPEQYANAILTKSGMSFKEWQESQKSKGVEKTSSAENESFGTPKPNSSHDNKEVVSSAKPPVKKVIETDKMVVKVNVKEITSVSPQTLSSTSKEKLTNVNVTKEAVIKKSDKHIAKTSSESKSQSMDLPKETSNIKSDKPIDKTHDISESFPTNLSIETSIKKSDELIVNTHNTSKSLLIDLSKETSNTKSDKSTKIIQSMLPSTTTLKTRSSKDLTKDKREIMSDKKETLIDKKNTGDKNENSKDKGSSSDKETLSEKKETQIDKKIATPTKVKESSVEKKTIAKPAIVRINKSITKSSNEKSPKTTKIEKNSEEIKLNKNSEEIKSNITNSLENLNQVKNDSLSNKKEILSDKKGISSDKVTLNENKEILIDKKEVTKVNLKESFVEKEKTNVNPVIIRINTPNSKNDKEKAPKDIEIEKITDTGEEIKSNTSNEEIVPNTINSFDKTLPSAENDSKNSQNVIPSQPDVESAIKNNTKDSLAVTVVEYLHKKPENTSVSEYTHKSKKQHGTDSVRENTESTGYAQNKEACSESVLSKKPTQQLEINTISICSKEELDNSKADRNITSATVETRLPDEPKGKLIITQEMELKHVEIHTNTSSSKNNIVESEKDLNESSTKNKQSEGSNTKCEEYQKTDIIGKITSTLKTNEQSCIESAIQTGKKTVNIPTDKLNAIDCETTPDKITKTNESVTDKNVNKTTTPLDDSNNANEITSPSPKRKVAKRMKSEIEVLMESLPKGLALFNDDSKRRRRELPCGRKHSNLISETKTPLTFKTPPEPVKALSMITTPMKNPFATDIGLHRITRSIVSADKSIKLAPWKSRIIRRNSITRSSRGTSDKSRKIRRNSITKSSRGAPEKSRIIQGNSRTRTSRRAPEKSTKATAEKSTKASSEKSTNAMPEKSEVTSYKIHKDIPDSTAKITHDKVFKKILEISNTPTLEKTKEHTEDHLKKSGTEICEKSRKPAADEAYIGKTDVIVGIAENTVRTVNKSHSVVPEHGFKKLRVRLNRSFVRKYWMNLQKSKTTAMLPTTQSKSSSESLRSGSKSRTPIEHANSLASLLLKALNSPSIPPPPPSFVKPFSMPNFADISKTWNTHQSYSNVATRAKVSSLSPQKLHPSVSLASTVQQQQVQPDAFNITDNTNYEEATAATIADLHCDESFLLTPLKTVSPAPSVVRQQTQQQPLQQKRSARLQQLIQKQTPQESIPAIPTQSTKEQLAPTSTSILQQQQAFFSPVEPKKEIEDEQTTATVPLQSLSTLISGGLPAEVVDNSGTRLYSFLHPAKYNRGHGAVLLDYCCPNLDGPMPAIDSTRDHSQVQSLVRELPAYIVMTTKVVTRADLEAKNNSIPASIRKKMEKLTSASITASAVRLPVITTTTATSTVTTAVPPVASTGSLPTYTPSITALQKQLPSTTTLTPKMLPFSLPVPTPSESLPPLTPFSAMIASNAVSAETVASTPPTLWQKPDYQRYNNLRNSMRRFDTTIKKYSPRICVLTYSERQRILESVISHTQLSPRDIDIATHLLDDYCQQIANIVPPKPISNVATPTSNTATHTTAPTGSNIGNNFSPPVTAVVLPVPHPGNSTTAAAQKLEQIHASAVQKVKSSGSSMVQRQVPIFDKDRNVIGYQMQVAPGTTNSVMSARTGIMSSKQTSAPPQSSAVKRPLTGGTPAVTLKQPAQESPRIFYTKPIQTSTPIAAANTTTSSTALEAAVRLGRNVTIRHIAAKNLTPPRVPTRPQMPSINVSGGIISKNLPKATLGTITTTSTSFMQSPTAVTTSQRVTRHTATNKSEEIVIITKDKDGSLQTSGNPDESILPDDERSSAELKEIKRERDDELLTGRS